MRPAVSSLHELLCEMQPERNEGAYVFTSVPFDFELASLDPIATIREAEGLTLVVEEQRARAAGLTVLFRASWVTLKVHSDLHAIGLTAAVASALAQAGISCNLLAGACHDHIFVPVELGDDAMAALLALQARCQAATVAAAVQGLPRATQTPPASLPLSASLDSHAAPMDDWSALSYENTRLPGARFVAVDLSDSSFEDVSLRAAVFRNVALSDARFQDVDLGNATFADANFGGARINGVLVSDLFRAYYQVNPR